MLKKFIIESYTTQQILAKDRKEWAVFETVAMQVLEKHKAFRFITLVQINHWFFPVFHFAGKLKWLWNGRGFSELDASPQDTVHFVF